VRWVSRSADFKKQKPRTEALLAVHGTKLKKFES
jgi:hypothetical protein